MTTQEGDKKIVILSYCGADSSERGRLTNKFRLRPVYHPLSKLRDWICPIKGCAYQAFTKSRAPLENSVLDKLLQNV